MNLWSLFLALPQSALGRALCRETVISLLKSLGINFHLA